MRDRLKQAADANNRSVNAEVVHRLNETLEMDDYQPIKNAHPDTDHEALSAAYNEPEP